MAKVVDNLDFESWRKCHGLPDWPELRPAVIRGANGDEIERLSPEGRAIEARFELVETTTHGSGKAVWIVGRERGPREFRP